MSEKLRMSMAEGQLAAYVASQVNASFPDPTPISEAELRQAMPQALLRLGYCFSKVRNKYFFDGAQPVFNHLHGDQYAMWLYILSNELFRQGADASVCSKLFLLNKALHGCDIYYEVALPDVFLLVHPLGTVLGRADYSDFLVAYQRVGVGSNHEVYPRLGRHVTLRPGATILGNCTIGDDCQIATDSLVLDRDVPSGTLWMGRPGQTRTKPNPAPHLAWRT